MLDLSHDFHHCAKSVADLEASLAWYRDTLGFQLVKRFQLPEAQLEIANLVAPGGLRLELLSRPNPAGITSSRESPVDLLGPGTMHICFRVADIAVAAEELRRREVTFIQEPKMIAPARVKNCWIADNEGSPIEFIEEF